MKNTTKRFLTRLSIVTLLAPAFLTSIDAFAEDTSTSSSSETTTETLPSTTVTTDFPEIDEVTSSSDNLETESISGSEENVVPVTTAPSSTEISTNDVSENTPASTASPVTTNANIPVEVFELYVTRQNDGDNYVNASPKSNDNLRVSAFFDGSEYSVSYGYNYMVDYDENFEFESADNWVDNYPVTSESAEQVIYKKETGSDEILAVYKVNLNFQQVVVKLQEPLSFYIPKASGFNRVYQETPDGEAVLVGSSYMSTDGYSFHVHAIPTDKAIKNNAQIYYDLFYTNMEDYELIERDPFLYIDGIDGVIKKYPVTIIPGTDTPVTTEKTYTTLNISAPVREIDTPYDPMNMPGKHIAYNFSKYESIGFTIILDKENKYNLHPDSTPKNERYVLQGYEVKSYPFKKIGANQYQAVNDHYLVNVNLRITDGPDVEILPETLALSESKVTLTTGESATVNASTTPADSTNNWITWTSDDESIATVIGGVIRGIKVGETTIHATTVNGLTQSVKVTVKNDAEKPVVEEVLKDDAGSGVTLSAPEGVLPNGVSLKVASIKDNDAVHKQLYQLIDSKFVLFDIKLFLAETGANVQPNGKVTVRIPIPTGFDPAKLKMYYFDEVTGKRELMNGWVEGDLYAFETDHFSYYALVEEEPEEKAGEESSKTPTSDSNKSDDKKEVKENSKTDETKEDKKNDKDENKLPQLGTSASIALPILGIFLIGLSGLTFFRRVRFSKTK